MTKTSRAVATPLICQSNIILIPSRKEERKEYIHHYQDGLTSDPQDTYFSCGNHEYNEQESTKSEEVLQNSTMNVL
jgi:hypothetical protein